MGLIKEMEKHFEDFDRRRFLLAIALLENIRISALDRCDEAVRDENGCVKIGDDSPESMLFGAAEALREIYARRYTDKANV